MKGISVLCCCLLLPVLAQADPELNWAAVYDSGVDLSDEGLLITSDPTGNPVVAGVSHDGFEGSDILVTKLNAGDGIEMWSTRIPAFDDSDMMVSGIDWEPGGDLILGGHICGCVG